MHSVQIIIDRLQDMWSSLFPLLAKMRFWILLLIHIVVFTLTCLCAFSIRFDFSITEPAWRLFGLSLLPLLTIKMVTFYAFQSFHGWWRYVTFSDLRALGKATVASFVFLVCVDYFLLPFQIPRSVLLIDAMLTVLTLGLVRSSWRLMQEEVKPLLEGKRRQRTMMVGTTITTVRLADQLRSQPQLGHEIIGLLSNLPSDQRQRLSSLPILGQMKDAFNVATAYRIDEILVPAGEITGDEMRSLKRVADDGSFKIRIIPRMEDVFSGSGKIPLREVDINDLLRREPVVLDDERITEMIRGRRVLVTGAGGSIGSEVCRQLLAFDPSELILLGRGENRIFAIEQELLARHADVKLIPTICDVTDQKRMRQVFESVRPEIVFHAAAHKHVPLMEANVVEAVKNNIVGTKRLADLADEYDVKTFVLVSTDKAVNPTSVMGATKHLAERYVNACSAHSTTKFIVVRFGNVLGSNGSVVPTFRNQIESGGPITITDPRMKRYFMTIPEASRLVLQAAAMGDGGEIFVLDMGEPIKIVDLAQDMIRLSGLPESAIEIVYSGIRPGEKLYEELYFGDEENLSTDHPKLRAALHRPHDLEDTCQGISRLEIESDSETLKTILQELVPEYSQHLSSTGGQPTLATVPFESAPVNTHE